MKRALLVLLMLGAFTIRAEAQFLAASPSTITALNGVSCVDVDKTIAAVTFTTTNTWAATVAPKMQHTNSATYDTPVSGASVASITSNGSITVTNYGARKICLQATAFTSGTITVTAVAGGAGLASITGGGDATAANQGTQITAANLTNTKLDNAAANDVAHGIADAGNPVKIGCRADTTTQTAEADGDRVNLLCTPIGQAWFTPSAHTLGGCTPNSSISGAAVLETEIKATAGQLYSLVVTNLDATNVYAKLYNDTAANTDQTDTPIQRYLVPTGGGFVVPIPVGMEFTTAITVRVTTGIADNDTGALTANEVLVSYCYK